jgi:hypothetical protein
MQRADHLAEALNQPFSRPSDGESLLEAESDP